MGILEKIAEIEFEMGRTQKNKASNCRSAPTWFMRDAALGAIQLMALPLWADLWSPKFRAAGHGVSLGSAKGKTCKAPNRAAGTRKGTGASTAFILSASLVQPSK